MTVALRARLLLACLAVVPAWGAEPLSDEEVKERLIEQSKGAYSGNCPCPDSVNRAGNRCGNTSAWSKKGGASVLCYPTDVTDEMVKRWREKNEK